MLKLSIPPCTLPIGLVSIRTSSQLAVLAACFSSRHFEHLLRCFAYQLNMTSKVLAFAETSFWLILLFHVACLVRFDLHLILTHLSGCLFGLFGCTDQIHLSGCLFRIVAISTLSQLTFSGCLFGSFRFAPYLNSPFRLPVLVRFDLYFIVTYLLAFAERCFSLPDTFYSHYGKRFPVLVLDCADPTPLDRLSDIPNFVVRTLFFHQTFPNIMFCTQHNVA